VQGREWERFAWLKSRVVAPAACIGTPKVQALRGVVLPFVFRRYLDYSVFDALRSLHRQIRDHAARSAGHPSAPTTSSSRAAASARSNSPCSCCRWCAAASSRAALPPHAGGAAAPGAAGLMPPRRPTRWPRLHLSAPVEHRIQYLDDQQTHVLPTRDDDLAWIAAPWALPTACAFLHELDAHRELVAQEFDTLLGGDEPCSGGALRRGQAAARRPELEACWSNCRRPARVADWRSHPACRPARRGPRAPVPPGAAHRAMGAQGRSAKKPPCA
jgi:glutamate-ammonia-ligase adenylyltransferase